MDNIEFEKTVANMRWAQKKYYAERKENAIQKKDYLLKSKTLESKIDAELKLRGYAV